ncbi:hypothetical protein PG993_007706 [Apiospora rasikravindrae]|uniref:Zn(2)-C6 fungal-type domain-containing protein n=1 Tax=Apiospora rasikravindrae TaxID=990691 RepID=A0ABR1SY91_9PEZI
MHCNFNAGNMLDHSQNNNTGSMGFPFHNSMGSMATMLNKPNYNYSTGDMFNGSQPSPYMDNIYPNPFNPQSMAIQAGNGSSDPTAMMSNNFYPTLRNADNATGHVFNSQGTMQYPNQPNENQNHVSFRDLDLSQNGNSLPVSQEQATSNNTNTNTNSGPSITSTSATTQFTSTSGTTSAPCQAVNSSPSSASIPAITPSVPAPAPAGPAKRGRKRKASSDPEAAAADQGQTQPKGPAPKKLKLHSCKQCRKSKIKCDGDFGKTCSGCAKKGIECVIDGQDRRTKLTNFEEIVTKLEKNHFRAMECMQLIIRATGTKEHFEIFQGCWKSSSSASNVLDFVGSFYKDVLEARESPSMAELAQQRELASFHAILQELRSSLEQKVKVKDLRPLKNKLKKAAHWVLAEAYRTLDTLAQKDAVDAVYTVDNEQYHNYFQWMHTSLGDMDLTDQNDANNKSFLRKRGDLIPRFLNEKCGSWVKKVECMDLVQQQLTPPPINNSASPLSFPTSAAAANYVQPQGLQPTMPPVQGYQSMTVGQANAPFINVPEQPAFQVTGVQNEADNEVQSIQTLQAAIHSLPSPPIIDPALVSAGGNPALPTTIDDRMDLDDGANNQGSWLHNPAPELTGSGSGEPSSPSEEAMDEEFDATLLAQFTNLQDSAEPMSDVRDLGYLFGGNELPEADQPVNDEPIDTVMADDYSVPSIPAEDPMDDVINSDSHFGGNEETNDMTMKDTTPGQLTPGGQQLTAKSHEMMAMDGESSGEDKGSKEDDDDIDMSGMDLQAKAAYLAEILLASPMGKNGEASEESEESEISEEE